jgi:hypothetical protein
LWDIELIEQGQAVQQLGGEAGEIPIPQTKAQIPEMTMVAEPQTQIKVIASQKSRVDAPPINQSIGLLSPKAIPDPKSALGLVEIGETASDSKDVAPDDYDSDIIIIDISRSENEGGKTQELAEHTRAT